MSSTKKERAPLKAFRSPSSENEIKQKYILNLKIPSKNQQESGKCLYFIFYDF